MCYWDVSIEIRIKDNSPNVGFHWTKKQKRERTPSLKHIKNKM